jgi:quinol monooxygenase YgiN
MRRLGLSLLGAAVIAAGLIQPATAQTASAPVYVLTYFDVAPSAAGRTADALRQFAAATRKEDGNGELTVLHEIGRPGRFAIVETWRDKAARDGHGAATKALAEKLHPDIASPFSTRQFEAFSVAPAASGADPASGVAVLTHVDVFPAGKDEAAAQVKQLAQGSRKDAGAVRFDAIIMEGRPNHFHLIEVWRDQQAREAHALADHTKQFRAKIVPLEGALYDERLYESIR